MSLPPLADTDQLEAWLGEPVEPVELVRAEAVLAAASTLVRSHVGRAWVDDDGNLDSPPDVAVTVAVQCAGRVWRNPDSAIHRTAGPFSERFAEQAGQGMWLSKTEKAMLDRLRAPSSAVWTMSTTRGDLETGGPSSSYGVDDSSWVFP
jgi:hypothetical protein